MSSLRLRADVHVAPLTLAAAPQMLAWMQDPDVSDNIGLTRSEPGENSGLDTPGTRTKLRLALRHFMERYPCWECGL